MTRTFKFGHWGVWVSHLRKALFVAGCLVTTWPISGAASAGGEQCSDAARAGGFSQAVDPADPDLKQFHQLRRELRRTFLDGDFQRAKALATQYLALAGKYPCDAGYGDAIYSANLYLGRMSVKGGDVTAAGNYLLAAGKTPGSRALDSVGPDLTLANELLGAGHADTVTKFLQEVRTFWKPGQKQLDSWTAQIKAGKRPYMNPLEGAASGTLLVAASFVGFLIVVPALPALLVFLAVGRGLRRKWSFLVSAVVVSYAPVFLVSQFGAKATGLTLIAPVLCACTLYMAWRAFERKEP
jgi:hypothetical protein